MAARIHSPRTAAIPISGKCQIMTGERSSIDWSRFACIAAGTFASSSVAAENNNGDPLAAIVVS